MNKCSVAALFGQYHFFIMGQIIPTNRHHKNKQLHLKKGGKIVFIFQINSLGSAAFYFIFHHLHSHLSYPAQYLLGFKNHVSRLKARQSKIKIMTSYGSDGDEEEVVG